MNAKYLGEQYIKVSTASSSYSNVVDSLSYLDVVEYQDAWSKSSSDIAKMKLASSLIMIAISKPDVIILWSKWLGLSDNKWKMSVIKMLVSNNKWYFYDLIDCSIGKPYCSSIDR